MQKTIFTENFLLQNKTAVQLYHEYAADLPIIDYHNHLSPQAIADDKVFENVTQVWLGGDHYKWRAMRAMGVIEKYITGTASDAKKFETWARCVPNTVRNPLFHWSHLELKNHFGIDTYLNGNNAKEVFEQCNAVIKEKKISPKSVFKQFKVEMCGTTDDPTDSLIHHKQLSGISHQMSDGSNQVGQDSNELEHTNSKFKIQNSKFKILPSFRPDKGFNIDNKPAFFNFIDALETASGQTISSFDDLITAFEKRVDYFHANGCRVSDHGLNTMPTKFEMNTALNNEFSDFLKTGRKDAIFSDKDAFVGTLLQALCKIYHARGWVQQFHLGALRNNNTRFSALLGADVGTDSVGDWSQAVHLSRFLDALDVSNQLAKTVLYNLNPADNELMATMAGNFNDGSISGKMQFGSAWWFLDQKDGMEKQLNALSNMGIISTFIGMTTDSRSFLSFPRHEYFRRTLCNLFATEMENGLLPNDAQWMGEIIKNICYYNAKKYFDL